MSEPGNCNRGLSPVAAISASQYQIFNKLLSLDATAVWAANQTNVPMALPAPTYQMGSPARSDYDSDYSYGDRSPEYYTNFPSSYLQALGVDPVYTEQQNSQQSLKGCFEGEEFSQEIFDIAALLSGDPDTDFLMNCNELELKETEANYSYSSCSPQSPGLSSCDDGYNSGTDTDGFLEILSNATGSPAPTEAVLEDSFSDYAPSPNPEEIKVVTASPSQPPRAKPGKLPHTPGRRKRGPRSLTLNNGNGPMQLWQFLLMILVNGPGGLVQWTHDEPFEFKLLNPNTVATMWGKVKNKPSMNYEKLSRGLRYYYGKKILEKVHGKRYVYQFQCDIPKILGYDPTATDPKQNVEDAVCDSPDISDAASDTSEECPPSLSSEDSATECWEFGPGLW